MRATPLTYEHEPRCVFRVVRDLRPDPRYILGIEVCELDQDDHCNWTIASWTRSLLVLPLVSTVPAPVRVVFMFQSTCIEKRCSPFVDWTLGVELKWRATLSQRL